MARELNDDRLALNIPASLRAALDRAAARRFTTPSEYTRQSLIERMRADGVEPTTIERPAAA